MNKQVIRIRVSGVVEAEKSYGALVDLILDENDDVSSAGRLVWFPKSICVYAIIESPKGKIYDKHIISAPKWLLEQNNVKH